MLEFYRGRRVFLTGHTGFKGAWLSRILILSGAEVTGYSLEPPTEPSVFSVLELARDMRSIRGDVRDYEHLARAVREAKPDVVLHLAAQPIVRESYRIPRETFEVNVMGTVNLLEAVRQSGFAPSVVNVTTDKVYRNLEVRRGYTEEDPLDGYDPYSNSKSCSDLVTHSYRASFFEEAGIPVSTARAGNVIGGGDFAADRIIPDCVRAVLEGREIVLRHPDSLRPYQHVLEPLGAYLLIAKRQAEDPSKAGAYNVGPGPESVVTTGELADCFTEAWGEGASWRHEPDDGPHEAGILMLDSTKLRKELGWRPVWTAREAVEQTVRWTKTYLSGSGITEETDREIREYFNV